MMGKPVPLKLVKPRVNKDAIAAVKALLARLKSGEVCAVGLVEVQVGGIVSTETFGADIRYHQLHSGAWQLAYMMAGMEDEE